MVFCEVQRIWTRLHYKGNRALHFTKHLSKGTELTARGVEGVLDRLRLLLLAPDLSVCECVSVCV